MNDTVQVLDPVQMEHHRKLVENVRASGLAAVYFAWATGRLEAFLAERENREAQATQPKVEYECEIPRSQTAGG